MRTLAFGEMDMSPKDFYEMEIEDFVLKVEGFVDGRIWFERSLRRLGQVIQAPLVSKDAPSMIKQWPIAKDDETAITRKRVVKSGAEQIMKMKQIIDAKQNINKESKPE